MSNQEIPSQAIALHNLLHKHDILEYEPRVIEQLLELSHKYTVEILQEAQILQRHAGHEELTAKDVNLAIKMRRNTDFIEPGSAKELQEIAKLKNTSALLANKGNQVLLPPERFCNSAANFQIKRRKLNHTS